MRTGTLASNVTPLELLEQFTCLIHWQSQESSVDIVCTKLHGKMFGEDQKLTSRSKVDLARLPHCLVALRPHIQLVNQRAALYNWVNEANLEKPYPYDDGQGTGWNT